MPFPARPCLPVFIFTSLRGPSSDTSGYHLQIQPAKFLLLHNTCMHRKLHQSLFGPLGRQWGASVASLILTDHVTTRPGPCLWSVLLGDTQNAIISHQSNRVLAPGAILTHWDGERDQHMITTPPTSISLLASACHCDLSRHAVHHHKPTYQERLLAHIERLPTVHAEKEALAPRALVTESK